MVLQPVVGESLALAAADGLVSCSLEALLASQVKFLGRIIIELPSSFLPQILVRITFLMNGEVWCQWEYWRESAKSQVK